MSDLNRREFVAAAAAACAFCIACPENTLAAPAKGPVDAGEVSTFTKQGVYDSFAKSGGFLIISDNGKLHASSSTCTHKSNLVGVDSENRLQLKCEKHGSLFNLDGQVVKPPAKRSLPRFAIRLNDKKHVVVDPTKRFEENDWQNPASFIKLG